jgi:hypothetical protein
MLVVCADIVICCGCDSGEQQELLICCAASVNTV